MIKAVFSASLLQSSVSHDPSEINLIYWFAAQETFLIIISVIKTVVLLHFFVENGNFFSGFIDKQKFKRTAFDWKSLNRYNKKY